MNKIFKLLKKHDYQANVNCSVNDDKNSIVFNIEFPSRLQEPGVEPLFIHCVLEKRAGLFVIDTGGEPMFFKSMESAISVIVMSILLDCYFRHYPFELIKYTFGTSNRSMSLDTMMLKLKNTILYILDIECITRVKSMVITGVECRFEENDSNINSIIDGNEKLEECYRTCREYFIKLEKHNE